MYMKEEVWEDPTIVIKEDVWEDPELSYNDSILGRLNFYHYIMRYVFLYVTGCK